MPNKITKAVKSLVFENRKHYHQGKAAMKTNVGIHMGWGTLFFAQTFTSPQKLVEELLREEPGERNLAFYVQEPQVLTHLSDRRLFLDPSVAYRLDLSTYSPPKKRKTTVQVRFLTKGDVTGANEVYQRSGALPIDLKKTMRNQHSKSLTYFVAEEKGTILGIVIGIDHKELFNSPEGGASAWGLAVSPKARRRGIGKKLIQYVAEHYKFKGRSYLDLSVMYDNRKAITLYEKMGFRKILRFCVKCKNPINQELY